MADLRKKELKTFERERQEDEKWHSHRISNSMIKEGKKGEERSEEESDDSSSESIVDKFMHLSSALHDASTLSVLPVSSFRTPNVPRPIASFFILCILCSLV